MSSVCVAASAVLYVMLLLCYGSGLLVVAGALLLQRHVVPRALLGQGLAILLYVCIFEHVYTILRVGYRGKIYPSYLFTIHNL